MAKGQTKSISHFGYQMEPEQDIDKERKRRRERDHAQCPHSLSD